MLKADNGSTRTPDLWTPLRVDLREAICANKDFSASPQHASCKIPVALLTLHLSFLNYSQLPKQAVLFHKSLPVLKLFLMPKMPFPDKYLLGFQDSEVSYLLEITFCILWFLPQVQPDMPSCVPQP